MFHVKRRPGGGDGSAGRNRRRRNEPGHETGHNTLRDAPVRGGNDQGRTTHNRGVLANVTFDDTESPDRLIGNFCARQLVHS